MGMEPSLSEAPAADNHKEDEGIAPPQHHPVCQGSMALFLDGP